FSFSVLPRPPRSPLFPYTTLFRSAAVSSQEDSIPRMRVLIKFPFCSLQFQILQVVSEVTAKFFILQANFHGRFQKPKFVARIVGNSFINVRPQTIFLRQSAQRIG